VGLLRRGFFVLAMTLLFLCSQMANAQSSTATVSGAQSYPNSSKGLKHLLEYAQQITQAGKQEELRRLARDLVIPDHPRWFATTFGGGQGDVLSAAYIESAKEMELSLPKLLSSLPMDKKWKIEVQQLSSADVDSSPVFESAFLIRKPMILYSVTIEKRMEARPRLGYFVYVDGAFRLLGRLLTVSLAGPRALLLLRPSDIYEPPHIVEHKQDFPHMSSGTRPGSRVFQYWVLIDREGIARLVKWEGVDAWSAKAFSDILPGWRYIPAKLNGQKIEEVIPIKIIETVSVVGIGP
jgi:hypothetical protein